MACPRSFIALRGLFILLLNILTAVHAHSASRRDLHGVMIGHSYKHRSVKPISASAWTGISSFKQKGTSGVAAMQMSVVDDRYVILFDKAEHNPLYTNDGNHAWSALIDTHTHTVRALKLKTNSFCAGGGWLSNGTLIDYGGSSQENIPSGNGYQGIRLFTPEANGGGNVWEDPATVHLTTNRWYPSSARISDGSQIIFGGTLKAGFNNYHDNPTLEFFPPKGSGKPIHSHFLQQALPSNLFPHMFTLPDNRIFVAANTLAMLYNWVDNKETRLPDLPNGVRVNYPWSGGAVLLPLTPENNYTPEVLICGGSTIDDSLPANKISSQTPASDQCARMVLDAAGIAAGWQTETMPDVRMMVDTIVMPDGNVLLINGAKTGVAGYGNVYNQIGQSNADHPAFTPWLYQPSAPEGRRFTTNFTHSTIARMYHSTASLLPDGSVLVAGSNPNGDVSTKKYATEYRVEYFQPPYISMTRPSFTGTPQKINYGNEFMITVSNPGHATKFKAIIMDLGFHTHAVSLDSKYVGLVSKYNSTTQKLTITGPPNAYIYPPGPAWLYILGDGIPSNGTKVMIGTGANPPFSAEAYRGALEYSKKFQAGYQYTNTTNAGDE